MNNKKTIKFYYKANSALFFIAIIAFFSAPDYARAYSIKCQVNNKSVCVTNIPDKNTMDKLFMLFGIGEFSGTDSGAICRDCVEANNPLDVNCSGAVGMSSFLYDPNQTDDYYKNCPLLSATAPGADLPPSIACGNGDSCNVQQGDNAISCKTDDDCKQNYGVAVCNAGFCYLNAAAETAMKQNPKILGVKTTLLKPQLEIRIPGLTFSEINANIDAAGNVSIPYLGEYIAALYNFAMIVASLIAVSLIVKNGLDIVMSAGGEGKTTAYKNIGRILIGLMLVWGSYTILFILNPQLVSFKVLKVKYIPKEDAPGLGAGEVRNLNPSDAWKNGIDNYNISDQCFPVDNAGFKVISWNWGDDRNTGSRCHAGIDLYTKDTSQVIAVDNGEVTFLQHMKLCTKGDTDAVLIYHPNLDVTVLYGEINTGELAKNKITKSGIKVVKGQLLGVASNCGMLHMEAYRGKRSSSNLQWIPPIGQSSTGVSKCAKEYLITKPNALMDPTNLASGLQGKFCTPNSSEAPADNTGGQSTQPNQSGGP